MADDPAFSEAVDQTNASCLVVGIGASAGGLEALRELFTSARAPTNMCFVIVQHLDPTHESMMAQLLDRHTNLEVLQCVGGEQVAPDKVLIIPPGKGLAIRGGVLELTDFAQPRGLRRPIDDFFLSLASDQQSNAACVILSGTGADGTTGLRAIKENGGICIVQEPQTAKYDGMPLSAVGTGLVDFVRAPADIVECLRGYFSRRHDDAHEEAEVVADHVDELCSVLRSAIGHDFSGYKRSTLVRRVERRMHVLGIETGRSYLQRVRSDTGECEALFRDLLINVTRFFRDPEAFEALVSKAVEPILRSRPADEEIRVWVPGCSSGEEAYTIAMLFAEATRRGGQPYAVQIFATDIDEQMLQIAREGIYPTSALADLPTGYRERYTMPHGDRFAVSPEIRDAIRFSNHSLVKDPPFSRIDLVSCRNLLIYFDDRLQQSVLPLLHYAVKPGGYLFLGPSESVGRFEHLFPVVDQRNRIFQRSPGAPNYPIDLPGGSRLTAPRKTGRDTTPAPDALSRETAAVKKLVERYAPPSMLLDGDGGIVAAYGRLGQFFDFPVTRAGGSSAITLAKPGLRTAIGPLLRKARESRKRSVTRDVEVTNDFGVQTIDLICDPMSDGTALMVIQERGTMVQHAPDGLVEVEREDDGLEALEEELRVARHGLRTAVEELETANEELKSSNEEMMSMNEELQSTNEELSTVNDELKSKVDQLTTANLDLRNFFESTDLAVVVLDGELRIRSFTEAARSVFPLQASDKGRPLDEVSSRLDDNLYIEDARLVAEGASAVERRVGSRDGQKTFSLRILPYRAQGGSVDGVTLVLTDISSALSLERDLAAERDRLDLAMQAGGIGIWEYFVDSGKVVLDDTEQRLFGYGHEAQIDQMLATVIDPEEQKRVREALERAAEGAEDFDQSFRIRVPEGEIRWIKGLGRTVPGSSPKRLVGMSVDVTAEHSLAETRELMIREMNHRVKNLFAIIGSMIGAAAKQHTDVPAFALSMRERIVALGRAHSLASPAGDQEAIDLGELVATAIEPYQDHADIRLEGPRVRIDRASLSPLAMMLHEWATNATKYGALSSPPGSLSVSWRHLETGIELTWRENFADARNQLKPAGFGTRLVEMSTRQMGADLRRSLEAGHLEMVLHLPQGVLVDG